MNHLHSHQKPETTKIAIISQKYWNARYLICILIKNHVSSFGQMFWCQYFHSIWTPLTKVFKLYREVCMSFPPFFDGPSLCPLFLGFSEHVLRVGGGQRQGNASACSSVLSKLGRDDSELTGFGLVLYINVDEVVPHVNVE